MRHEAKRVLKFCLAWGFYGLGHVMSIAGEWVYWVYEKCMVASDRFDEGWVWEDQ